MDAARIPDRVFRPGDMVQIEKDGVIIDCIVIRDHLSKGGEQGKYHLIPCNSTPFMKAISAYPDQIVLIEKPDEVEDLL